MDIDPIRNPELFNPESQVAVVLAVAIFLMAAATTAVGLRFYTRHIILRSLGTDDWLALVALVFALATGITQCFMTRVGLGRHVGLLPQPDGLTIYLQNFFAAIVFYNASLGFVKMTFLTQYYRVLAIQKLRRICLAAMVFVGIWSVAQTLIAIFLCRPVRGFWDKTIEYQCIDIFVEWYQNAAGNIITDIVIFVIPLPAIGGLKLPRQQKWVLLAIFSLGFFTSAISLIRLAYLHMTVDTTWENVPTSLWSLCEVCVGITCASLPTLRPLISRWVPGMSSRIHKSTKGSQRYPDSSGTHPHRSDIENSFNLTSMPRRSGPGLSGFQDFHFPTRKGSRNALRYDDDDDDDDRLARPTAQDGDEEDSDGIVGLRDVREELQSRAGEGSVKRETSRETTTREELRSRDSGGAAPAVTPATMLARENWQARGAFGPPHTSVTTEIRTGAAMEPGRPRARSQDRDIYVKHDLVVNSWPVGPAMQRIGSRSMDGQSR